MEISLSRVPAIQRYTRSLRISVEQVKADNGADDAAVALLCLTEGTDNKEKYEQGRDAL